MSNFFSINKSSNFFEKQINEIQNNTEIEDKENNLFEKLTNNADDALYEIREFLGVSGGYESFISHKEKQNNENTNFFEKEDNIFPEKSLLLNNEDSLEANILLFQEEIEKTNSKEEDTKKT